MLLSLTLSLALAQSTTHLTIAPWSGKAPATTTAAAAKYRLTIVGAPNAALTLKASRLARGWLAAFCTPKVCAPMQVDVRLPASGRTSYAFELIREDESAPAHSGASIESSDGASIAIAP
ncbi:MAG TPA: hypothetical protein VMF61_13270 [Candidatus Acidoferrales bacterium]|nr:hypothetical protein [Candidatus Acidoferrales bacterium]